MLHGERVPFATLGTVTSIPKGKEPVHESIQKIQEIYSKKPSGIIQKTENGIEKTVDESTASFIRLFYSLLEKRVIDTKSATITVTVGEDKLLYGDKQAEFPNSQLLDIPLSELEKLEKMNKKDILGWIQNKFKGETGIHDKKSL